MTQLLLVVGGRGTSHNQHYPTGGKHADLELNCVFKTVEQETEKSSNMFRFIIGPIILLNKPLPSPRGNLSCFIFSRFSLTNSSAIVRVSLRRPSRTLHGTETSTRRKSSRSYSRGLTWKAKVKDDAQPHNSAISTAPTHPPANSNTLWNVKTKPAPSTLVKSHSMTLDPTGELTLEEFIIGAKDHEDIMDMLKKIMDLTPVLVIIVKGRNGWRLLPTKTKDTY